MSEVLTQHEINCLLQAIGTGDQSDYFDLEAITPKYKDLDEFKDFLTKRTISEAPFGIFEKSPTIIKFFNGDKHNENILADIKKQNEENGSGNISIPNTNITLLNYSYCPKCGKIFSFKDVAEYYSNPIVDAQFGNRASQYRNDTRIFCDECKTFFLPSLIIEDGTPKNEVQFLCRSQTIDAIEKFFLGKNVSVLTKKRSNVILEGKRGILNDVFIKEMEEKPTLISNMLQYTPYNKIINLIEGTNIENKDYLFDNWE